MLQRHSAFITRLDIHFNTYIKIQVSLGEMVSYLPVSGGHIKLAERFVDPAFSFALGWNYWYNWTLGLPAELSAAAVLMQFWKSVRPTVFHRVSIEADNFSFQNASRMK